MICNEGDILKNDVLDKIEQYLAAEQAQYTCDAFEEDAARLKAEMAHASLAESRRHYWEHIKLHRCDAAAILAAAPATLDSIAV